MIEFHLISWHDMQDSIVQIACFYFECECVEHDHCMCTDLCAVGVPESTKFIS